jgi:hypothetical protein
MRRPKPAKLAVCPRLREVVEGKLAPGTRSPSRPARSHACCSTWMSPIPPTCSTQPRLIGSQPADTVTIRVTGPATRIWRLVASLTMSSNQAWRLLTNVAGRQAGAPRGVGLDYRHPVPDPRDHRQAQVGVTPAAASRSGQQGTSAMPVLRQRRE